jgi:hypothetical protein
MRYIVVVALCASSVALRAVAEPVSSVDRAPQLAWMPTLHSPALLLGNSRGSSWRTSGSEQRSLEALVSDWY